MSARFFRWCGGTVLRVERVSSAQYLKLLVVAQKKATDSTYSMGIEIWDLRSWSSSGLAFGAKNATEGVSSRRTQMHM